MNALVYSRRMNADGWLTVCLSDVLYSERSYEYFPVILASCSCGFSCLMSWIPFLGLWSFCQNHQWIFKACSRCCIWAAARRRSCYSFFRWFAKVIVVVFFCDKPVFLDISGARPFARHLHTFRSNSRSYLTSWLRWNCQVGLLGFFWFKFKLIKIKLHLHRCLMKHGWKSYWNNWIKSLSWPYLRRFLVWLACEQPNRKP